MFQFVFTGDELAQLQAMLADWLDAGSPDEVTPLVKAVCDKLGVSTGVVAPPPMRRHLR